MFNITQCKKFFDENDVEYEEPIEGLLSIKIKDEGVIMGSSWLSFSISFDNNGKFESMLIEE